MLNPKAQQGSSLMEVLVAVLVLSIGMVGALRLQSEAVRQNADSKYVTLASLYAQTALDNFGVTSSGVAWVGQSAWEASVTAGLPQGEAEIDCSTTPTVCSVEISWIAPGNTERERARYAVRRSS